MSELSQQEVFTVLVGHPVLTMRKSEAQLLSVADVMVAAVAMLSPKES